MSLAELDRFMRAKTKQDQRKASFDYILADLIGRSIARAYNSSNKMPTLAEAYPGLFSKEEEQKIIQERKDELSALRFRQFASQFNKKLKRGD